MTLIQRLASVGLGFRAEAGRSAGDDAASRTIDPRNSTSHPAAMAAGTSTQFRIQSIRASSCNTWKHLTLPDLASHCGEMLPPLGLEPLRQPPNAFPPQTGGDDTEYSSIRF